MNHVHTFKNSKHIIYVGNVHTFKNSKHIIYVGNSALRIIKYFFQGKIRRITRKGLVSRKHVEGQ
jgi:hypothetical protein